MRICAAKNYYKISTYFVHLPSDFQLVFYDSDRKESCDLLPVTVFSIDFAAVIT